MFSGRDQYALLHQAGGVADFCNIFADGFDFVSVEIDATKHNARAGGSRKDAQFDGGSAMKSNTAAFDGGSNCAFE